MRPLPKGQFDKSLPQKQMPHVSPLVSCCSSIRRLDLHQYPSWWTSFLSLSGHKRRYRPRFSWIASEDCTKGRSLIPMLEMVIMSSQRKIEILIIYLGIWMFPKIGVPPNHPFAHRVFHYYHHPFWGTTIFGNSHINPYHWVEGFPSPLIWKYWEFFHPIARLMMNARLIIRYWSTLPIEVKFTWQPLGPLVKVKLLVGYI